MRRAKVSVGGVCCAPCVVCCCDSVGRGAEIGLVCLESMKQRIHSGKRVGGMRQR